MRFLSCLHDLVVDADTAAARTGRAGGRTDCLRRPPPRRRGRRGRLGYDAQGKWDVSQGRTT